MDSQLFKWSQKDCCQTKPLKKHAAEKNTNNLCSIAELLVFYLRSVIYFKNMEDKELIYPFGMTKEASGTDTLFITSRQIEVWRDEGGTEAQWVHRFYKHMQKNSIVSSPMNREWTKTD